MFFRWGEIPRPTLTTPKINPFSPTYNIKITPPHTPLTAQCLHIGPATALCHPQSPTAPRFWSEGGAKWGILVRRKKSPATLPGDWGNGKFAASFLQSADGSFLPACCLLHCYETRLPSLTAHWWTFSFRHQQADRPGASTRRKRT